MHEKSLRVSLFNTNAPHLFSCLLTWKNLHTYIYLYIYHPLGDALIQYIYTFIYKSRLGKMTFTVLNSGSLSSLSQKLSHDFIYNPKKQECHHRHPLISSLIKQSAWCVSVTCLRLRMVRSMLLRSGGDSAWLSRAMGSPMSSSLVLSTSVSSGHLCTTHGQQALTIKTSK